MDLDFLFAAVILTNRMGSGIVLRTMSFFELEAARSFISRTIQLDERLPWLTAIAFGECERLGFLCLLLF